MFGVISSGLPADLRPMLMTLSLPLGIALGIVLYFRIGHEKLQYDAKGFMWTKGHRVAGASEWNKFREVSLYADSSGAINLRLYVQRDGEYVELPVSRTGLDPFKLRNAVLSFIKRGRDQVTLRPSASA